MPISKSRRTIARKHFRGIEGLESRLVLSSTFGIEAAHANMLTADISIVGGAGDLRSANVAHGSVIATGDDTSISPKSYTAIYNAKVIRRGFGPTLLGTGAGAYAEFTIDVTQAGTYSLKVGVGSVNGSIIGVTADGNSLGSLTLPGTGGINNFQYQTITIALDAGTQTLRLTALYGTIYNLSSLDLTYQPPANPTPDPATILSNDPVTPVGESSNTGSTTGTTGPSPMQLLTSPGDPGATIQQQWMTSFTELDVSGTTANETLLISQSGNTLTINANGQIQQATGTFGTLVVYASSGNDIITVDSSVTLPTTIYSGSGSDTITNLTRAQATIVSIGGIQDVLTGNGVNTAFWADSTDKINATTAERNNGGVHVVSSFYQPFTTVVGAPGYISNQRDGSLLQDPTSSGTGTVRLPNSSFWGTGPTMTDVNQGQAGDCYFLTCLQSLANFQPGKLVQMGVDLGDGTYCIQFQRNGVTSYVRVDGDLPSGGGYASGLLYDHPGVSGDQWAVIFEKAYAEFRTTGANSYASLDNGFMTSVYSDLGVASSLYALPAAQSSFYSKVISKLAADKPVDVLTQAIILGSAPLVASHTYTVLGVSTDGSGNVWVTLRNPWGVDGFNYDSNPNDGILTISYSTLLANSIYGSTVT